MRERDVTEHNRLAWNRLVEEECCWTVPVTSEDVARARQGDWSVAVTPLRKIPATWLGPVEGKEVLCLASGGGQQGPILAAAGAHVTVYDLSQGQLERDRQIAQRESLVIKTVHGSMVDLSTFSSDSFDLIIHPVSNAFVPDIRPVWKEAYRVLKQGGTLISGFTNPIVYAFDWDALKRHQLLQIARKLPYSDLESLTSDEIKEKMDRGKTVEFGHSMEQQLAGQTDAGFVIAGFYEDGSGENSELGRLMDRYLPSYFATRARKI